MTKDAFVQLVQQSEFLGSPRQEMLVENAAWMSTKERAKLAQDIQKTGQKMEKNSEEMLAELEKVETAVKDFNREEVPKIRKEVETKEHRKEAGKAEKLLEEY